MTNCRVGYSRKGNGSFRIRQESDDPIGHSKQASSNGQFAESSSLIGHKNSIWMCNSCYDYGKQSYDGYDVYSLQVIAWKCHNKRARVPIRIHVRMFKFLLLQSVDRYESPVDLRS